MKNTNIISALIIAAAFVLGIAIISNTYKNRFDYKNSIYVKGMASKNFVSDLIVWEGSFKATSSDLKQAYAKMQNDRDIVYKYLQSKGLADSEIVFNAIDISKLYDQYYDDNGNSHSIFTGYELSQDVKIMSGKVNLVEKISREITELMDKGVYFISYQPDYYYTKLDELKIQMIAEATENAKKRAEQIASNSNARLGKLQSARLGVFQITGLYSNEDYSWGGTFNTSSKLKTATVTVTLKFNIR